MWIQLTLIQHKDELINKEGKFYTFTFGEDYYNTLVDTRNVNLINNSNNPEYRDEVIDEIQKQIYVNQELDKNKLALEKTLDDLQTKRDEVVLRETNEIEKMGYMYIIGILHMKQKKYDYIEVTYGKYCSFCFSFIICLFETITE